MAIPDKRMTEDEVVAELRDGMTIGVGGWGSRRKPMSLIREILRSDLRDLTVVSYGGPDIGLLARAGIAESKAGRGGGYRLARSPKNVTMLEVVEAAEGSLVNGRCTLRGGPCNWEGRCAVHDTWTAAAEALRRSLARTSLARVVTAI